MPSDYGYINARIRAMKSFLLKEEDYGGVLRQRNPAEFLSFLSNLPSYANDLRMVFSGQPESSAADEALKLNLCRIFRRIVNFCEGRPKRLILILLAPWDIYNLKTIIRGFISFQDREKIISALIPAGGWDLEFLRSLARVKDLKALADNLATLGQGDLERGSAQLIRRYPEDLSLELLEYSLNALYFSQAKAYLNPSDNNAKILLDYLSLKADFLNILLVLKKISQPDVPINFTPLEIGHQRCPTVAFGNLSLTGFIQGGRLPEAFFKDLSLAKSVEEALKRFPDSSHPWLASEGLTLYERTKKLSSLERLLKNRLFSFCSHLYIKGDPLSISIPLAFINFKENEVRNLRLLGKVVNFGLPYHLIKEELIYAG